MTSARGPHLWAVLALLLSLGAFLCAPQGASAAIYWASAGGFGCAPPTGSIGRANLDGTLVDQSFITGADDPTGVAVDSGHLYWSNTGPCLDTIGRANLDGTGVDEHFVGGASGPSGPAGIAVDQSHVYWGNLFGYASIGTADLAGTNINEHFVDGAAGPCAVAADANHIYWANSGINASGNPNANAIGRADSGGANANQTFITGADQPCGVAVDASHVYWTNSGGTSIGRANLNGTSPDQNFVTGASSPCGVAVDASHIYWANADGDTIGRANLDGTGVVQNFITGASSPCGVAVDAVVVHPVAPANTTAPAITGTVAVGQVLGCSQGTWKGSLPLSYEFQWLSDGSVVRGTGAAYTVTADDRGHALTCQVTAKNEAGQATATSAAVQVPAPALTSVIPVLVTPARLTAPGRLKLGARAVTFTLRCQGSPGQRCKGTALLRVTRNASKTLTVGKLAFVVNAGASKSVTVKLNRVGRKLLARLHVLKARLTVTAASGGTILNKKIRFRR